MPTTNEKIQVDQENCSGCRICQLMCSFIQTKSYNPAKAYIIIEEAQATEPFRITFSNRCNGCGVCVRYCFYGALKIAE